MCWKNIKSMVEECSDNSDDIILPYKYGEDIVLERIESRQGAFGSVRCNVPRTIVRHSPTGYNFGYSGSGPADLALNILLLFEDLHFADECYQEFKFNFVANIDQDRGGVIKFDRIKDWISRKKINLFNH